VEWNEERIFHGYTRPLSTDYKDPVLAALLSTVIPGAGQVYNLQFLKGLLVFLSCWLIIPYFLGIFDAYVTSSKANRWQPVVVGRRYGFSE
jgi:TM2 domain-containing membrane protein YozV